MEYRIDEKYNEEHEHETKDVVLQGTLTKVDIELSGIIDFINNIASVQVFRSCQDKNGKVWLHFDMMEFISFMSIAFGAKIDQDEFESIEGTPDCTHDNNLYDFIIYHCHRDLVLEFFEDFPQDLLAKIDDIEDEEFEEVIEGKLEQKANCFISLTFDKTRLETFKRLLYRVRTYVI